jgi:hypothetical protein
MLILALAAALHLLVFVRLAFDCDDVRYVLSAQAQALAAVLALVFTLTIVVTQVRSSYGLRSWSRAFWPWGLTLVAIQSAGIVLPLALLGCTREVQLMLLPASLTLCVMSLGMVIPYYLALGDSLSAQALLQEILPIPLRPRAISQWLALSNGLTELTGLMASSLDKHDYVLSQAAALHLADATLDSLIAPSQGKVNPDVLFSALTDTASSLGGDATGVTQMARSASKIGEIAVARKVADGVNGGGFAGVFAELGRQAVKAKSRNAMSSVIDGFCYVSWLLVRQNRLRFFEEGFDEVNLASHDGAWAHIPDVEDLWCKWMWIIGAGYATQTSAIPSSTEVDNGIWRRVLKALVECHSNDWERVRDQLKQARDFLRVMPEAKDKEALQRLSDSWLHLTKPT